MIEGFWTDVEYIEDAVTVEVEFLSSNYIDLLSETLISISICLLATSSSWGTVTISTGLGTPRLWDLSLAAAPRYPCLSVPCKPHRSHPIRKPVTSSMIRPSIFPLLEVMVSVSTMIRRVAARWVRSDPSRVFLNCSLHWCSLCGFGE